MAPGYLSGTTASNGRVTRAQSLAMERARVEQDKDQDRAGQKGKNSKDDPKGRSGGQIPQAAKGVTSKAKLGVTSGQGPTETNIGSSPSDNPPASTSTSVADPPTLTNPSGLADNVLPSIGTTATATATKTKPTSRAVVDPLQRAWQLVRFATDKTDGADNSASLKRLRPGELELAQRMAEEWETAVPRNSEQQQEDAEDTVAVLAAWKNPNSFQGMLNAWRRAAERWARVHPVVEGESNGNGEGENPEKSVAVPLHIGDGPAEAEVELEVDMSLRDSNAPAAASADAGASRSSPAPLGPTPSSGARAEVSMSPRPKNKTDISPRESQEPKRMGGKSWVSGNARIVFAALSKQPWDTTARARAATVEEVTDEDEDAPHPPTAPTETTVRERGNNRGGPRDKSKAKEEIPVTASSDTLPAEGQPPVSSLPSRPLRGNPTPRILAGRGVTENVRAFQSLRALSTSIPVSQRSATWLGAEDDNNPGGNASHTGGINGNGIGSDIMPPRSRRLGDVEVSQGMRSWLRWYRTRHAHDRGYEPAP